MKPFLKSPFTIILSALCLTIALLIGVYGYSAYTQSPEANSSPIFRPIEANKAVANSPTLRLTEAEQQLEIWLNDVTNIYALDLQLQFDPAQRQAADADTGRDGIQLQPGQAPAPDFVATNSIDNQTGNIHYAVTQLAPRAGFSGSGLVGIITWQNTAGSTGDISVAAITLVDEQGQAVEVSVQTQTNQTSKITFATK